MTARLDKRNPLVFSQRFTCYIEKNRILQLFQELSSMLLMKKPDDHLLFLKQSLYHAARRLDEPRVMIITPPGYDKTRLVQKLQKKLNIPVITLNDIHDHPESVTLSASNSAIENLKSILIQYMKAECDGWLFFDFPRNEKEAKFLVRSGIIATHVIEIIPPDSLQSTEDPVIKEYYKELRGLRHVFSNCLTPVNADCGELEDTVQKCLSLIKSRKYSRELTNMRILLIDTVDCKRGQDLGRYIAEVYDVIYIHFCDVVEQISFQDTDLGDKVREILDGNKPILPPEVKREIFEDFLSRSAALRQGWVLTDYPSTVEDFRHLDMTDYPPNRVMIIVNNDYVIKEETLLSFNPENGTPEVPASNIVCDCAKEDEEDGSFEGIIEYAGQTATIVREAQDLKVMKERIDYFMMQAPANARPRMPRPAARVNFEDIEFDPDDEPCIEQLEKIRSPEPILSLI